MSGEQRINEKLLSYWEEKKGSRLFPLESEINPDELEQVWDSCFLVSVDAAHVAMNGSPYHYIYLGQSLVDAYGDDLGNRQVCEQLIYPGNMSLIHHFDEIVTTKQPANDESEFKNINNMLIKYRSCMMPLGKDNSDEVAYIIGGMKWKAF